MNKKTSIIKIIAILGLISNLSVFAAQINSSQKISNGNNSSFEDMLRILQEKESLDNKNKFLTERINTLEKASSANTAKYEELLKQYNLLTKNKAETKIQMNQLLEDEKQNRLPIPYLIINRFNQKYAKVLKL